MLQLCSFQQQKLLPLAWNVCATAASRSVGNRISSPMGKIGSGLLQCSEVWGFRDSCAEFILLLFYHLGQSVTSVIQGDFPTRTFIIVWQQAKQSDPQLSEIPHPYNFFHCRAVQLTGTQHAAGKLQAHCFTLCMCSWANSQQDTTYSVCRKLLTLPLNVLAASVGLHIYPPNTQVWQQCEFSMSGKVVLKDTGTSKAGGV